MIVLRTADFRKNIKEISEKVTKGEKVLILRPHNENIVIISEKEYNELEKIKSNMEYLEKVDKSLRQIQEGKLIEKTIDELEQMEI